MHSPIVSAALRHVTMIDIRRLVDSNLVRALPGSGLIGHLGNV